MQEPGAFVTSVLNNVFSLLQDHSLAETEMQQRLRTLALASFDVDGVTRFVAGAGWRSASLDQRKAFEALLQDYVMHLYGSRVHAIEKAPRFSIASVRQDGDVAWVKTSFPIPEGPSVQFEWRVVRTPAGERVADLSVVGISLMKTGRDEFAAVLAKHDNSLPALMDVMRRHLTDLGPGEPADASLK